MGPYDEDEYYDVDGDPDIDEVGVNEPDWDYSDEMDGLHSNGVL